MSVYPIKDSRFWQFDFQIDGYRFSGSTKCTHKRDAQAHEDAEKVKARELVAALRTAAGEPLRLGAACDRWWSEVGNHGSERDLKTALDWIKAQLGDRTFLHAITNDMVSRLVEARREARVRAGRITDDAGKVTQLWRPITAKRVNKTTVSLLRRVMNRALENWDAVIPKPPAWDKHWLKEIDKPFTEISHGTEAAIDAQQDPDYGALRRFAIITGLRRRNLILTWPQVDFEQAVVRIITKGGVPRVLPLSKEAYAILWSRRGHHPEFVFTFVAKRTKPNPRTGKRYVRGQRYPITYYGLGSHWRYANARAGTKARIHDMRHTSATRTLRTTGNLKVVQTQLGHSDIKTTADIYAHVLLEDVRAAMEKTAAAAVESREKSHGTVDTAAKPLTGRPE